MNFLMMTESKRKNLPPELKFSRILTKVAKEKLEIVLFAPVQGEAGGRGVWGGNSARRAQPVPFGYFQTDTEN